MIKTVLNPQYSLYKDFISDISSTFDHLGKTIYEERNTIKRTRSGEFEFGIKKFRTPLFINQIAYSFIRASKAKRAYEYGFIILSKGFLVPDPVAYIEHRKYGLLKDSYYVYQYTENVTHIRKQMSGEIFNENFYEELGAYIAALHEKGIFPLDLSPGNVLIRKEEGKTVFIIIDYNRLKFMRHIPTEKRYKSFKRLSFNAKVLDLIAKSYAKHSGLDEKEAIEKISFYCKRFFKGKYIEN